MEIIDFIERYNKQIKLQGFNNEYNTIIYIEDDDNEFSDEILSYWNDDEYRIFDFLIDGDKFKVGELVNPLFLVNLFNNKILKRNIEVDFHTDTFIITERKYFYDAVDCNDEGKEIDVLTSLKPTIFYKIKPFYED